MKSILRLGATAATLCLFVARSVAADPVTITSGSLLVTGLSEASSIAIEGSGGFSLRGPVAPSEGFVAAVAFCGFGGCAAGDRIGLDAELGGFALGGSVITYQGVIYPEVTGFGPTLAHLRFDGSVTLPAFEDRPLIIRAPFTMRGEIVFSDDTAAIGPLAGAGSALLWLLPAAAEPGLPRTWMVDDIRYDFAADAAPVPEPATLLLLGSGLVATLRRCRRHAIAADNHPSSLP